MNTKNDQDSIKEAYVKYFSIDIETTGLDPEKDQILQIGMVFEDTELVKHGEVCGYEELPSLEILVKHERITGHPKALAMNAGIIQQIADGRSDLVMRTGHVPHHISNFVAECLGNKVKCPNTINVAGKNFNSFDRLFLEKLPTFNNYIRMRHRVIDPATLCMDWSGDRLPDLQSCLKSQSINATVAHTAVSDAMDVIRVLRKATNYYSS